MTFVLWASPRRLLQAQRYSKEGRLLYGGPGRDYGNNPDYEQGLTAAQEGNVYSQISPCFSAYKLDKQALNIKTGMIMSKKLALFTCCILKCTETYDTLQTEIKCKGMLRDRSMVLVMCQYLNGGSYERERNPEK